MHSLCYHILILPNCIIQSHNLVSTIHVYYLSQTPVTGFLENYLGPLTAFADQAGALQVTLADGSEALAIVRRAHAPYGHVVLVHPLNLVFADWTRQTFHVAALLAATVFVLLALSPRLFLAGRPGAGGRPVRIRLRAIDAALNRGHCGLWDWDLTAAHLLVGFDVRDARHGSYRQCMSLSEMKTLIHPTTATSQTGWQLLA